MNIELGLTQGAVNTQYAPLGAIIWHYEQSQRLKPLEEVLIPIKTRDYSPASKLKQVLYSILAGCEYLVEVNSRLKAEKGLAQISGLAKFSDQATLSRTLDAVTLMNIEQLRTTVTTIWGQESRTVAHDWRAYLWLDFDLSGLPCSKRAEKSSKGYFSGKKTRLAVKWRGSVPSNMAKPFGLICLPVTA